MKWSLEPIAEPIGYRQPPKKRAVFTPRCHCGRFMSKKGICSLMTRVYRGGTFVGWEHY